MGKKTQISTVVSDSDRALFRDTIGVVQPLAEPNRVLHPRKPINYVARQGALESFAISDYLSDHLYQEVADEYCCNGIAGRTLKQLKKVYWGVAGRIDLHGYTVEQARRQLLLFLQLEHQNQARCVLIIHGKGMNSPVGQPILRDLCRHWLQQHKLVLAYCAAPAQYGGNGAVLVLLRG